MKISFECSLKEIVESAIACQEQSEKLEQPERKEVPDRIISAILAGVDEFVQSQQKECE